MLLVVFIAIPLSLLFQSKPTEAAWWNDSWQYRKSIPITNNTTAENNVYASLSIDTSDTTKFQTDCGDLRFTKYNGELLPYYINSGCGTASTSINVNFDVFPAGAQTIYYYYGNPSADNGFSASNFSVAASNYTVGSLGSEEKGPGPVAYWKFDEGYGNTVNNSTSVSGINGTVTTATWKNESDCLSGKCLDFPGSGDVTVPDNSNIDFGTGSFTVGMWGLYRDFTYPKTWFMMKKSSSCYTAGNPGWDIGHSYRSNGINICYSDGTNGVANNGLIFDNGYTPSDTKNKWTHLTIVFDKSANRVKAYVNGVKQTNELNISAVTGSVNNASSLFIGGNMYGWMSDGRIDEVKIYPYARTAAQIAQDYNAGLAGMGTSQGAAVTFGGKSDKWMSDGLVGHWKMDESSGTAVADVSGNGNTGTLTNAQETGTSDASGNTVTTMVDTDGALATASAAYNGMILRFTATCGSITSGTERLISGYSGASKIFTMATLSVAPDSCAYEVRHQTGGKFGNGISFGGDNDYVPILNYPNFSTEVTYSAWIKRSGLTGQQGIVSLNRTLFQVTSTQIDWYPDVDVSIVSQSTTLNQGEWYLITVTQSGTSYNIYKNGQSIKSGTAASLDATNSNKTLGSYGGARYFGGLMDEVRVYNRALSPGEVSDLYNWAPGPVGHWKMDEKVSGDAKTIYDTSGNGSNGTTYYGANATGMDCTVPGKLGNGCHFDGADDYIEVGDNSALELTSDFTVSLWLKTPFEKQTADGYWPGIFGKGAASNAPANGWGFTYQGVNGGNGNCNNFVWQQDTAGGGAFTASLASGCMTNGWHLISVRRSGTTSEMYIDGKYKSNDTTADGDLSNAYNVRIGRDNGSDYLKGSVDDVKIFNYARTPKQILEDMNGGGPAVSMPLAYYKFDEGYGGTAHNDGIGGSVLNGTLSGATWSQSGKFGKALSWDSTDLVSSSLIYNNATAFTLSAYIYPTATGSFKIIAGTSKGNNVDSGIILVDNNVCYHDYVTSGDYSLCSTNNPVQLNQWQHVAFSYNNGSINIYHNGINVKSGTFTKTDTSASLIIGGNTSLLAERIFSGLIDEVKIYNYALTADDVKADYNRGASIVLGSTGTDSSGNPDSSASREYCVPGDATSCAGPVGEWKMDEKVSGDSKTLYDTSGNGHVGTTNDGVNNTGMDCRVPGKLGSSCDFDGTDDYVNVGNTSAYYFNGTEPFSISVWFNIDDTGGYLVGRHDSGVLGNWRFWVESSKLKGYREKNPYSAITGDTTIVANTWNQGVFVYDGTNMKLYLNGKQDATPLASGDITANQANVEVLIGAKKASGVPNNFFPGKIDQVQIFNYARTPAQIAWDYNRGGPVGWWKMDECQGGTIHDSTNNRNDGTWSGTGGGTQTSVGTCTTSGTAWGNGTTGKLNSSLNFDGTDDYVSVTVTPSLEITSAVSLSGWVKFNATTQQSALFGRGNYQGASADRGPYKIGYYTPNNRIWWTIGNGTNASLAYADFIPETGRWYFIAATWDGTTNANGMKVYIDGRQAGQATSTISSLTNSKTFDIGSNNFHSAAQFHDGQIDEVKVFNYALTPLQIKTEYTGGAIRFGN